MPSGDFSLFALGWGLVYGALTLVFLAFGLHRLWIVYLYWRHRGETATPARRFTDLPVVTVQLPIFNEYFVAARLLNAVAALDYPRELLEIQALDDSTDETREVVASAIHALKQEGFDATVIHRVDRTGFKAGALSHGMETARGEFFLILDADFVPTPDLLQRTVHHFTDQTLGMVQSRWGHLNRDASWLTQAEAVLLDGHLLLEQTARSRSGRFFNFNGTAGIWRRSAIEEAGGWQHDTLTEDLDLSYRAQLAGWRFLFLPDLVTPAELPPDMAAFKSQQHRWTKGSIQTCLKLLPRVWRSELSWPLKLEAVIHLTSNFSYLALALICLLIQPALGAEQNWTRFVLLDVPVFLGTTLSVVIFYLVAQRVLRPGQWWRELWRLPWVLAVGIGLSVNNAKAVLEALMRHETGFNRTPKFADSAAARRRYRLARTGLVPFVELAFAIYFAYLIGFAWRVGCYPPLPFLVLFCAGFSLAGIGTWWPPAVEWFERRDRPPSETVPAT
ncbi:glycosyl transferase family 2 [Verrucomicrobia bacterium SCGC AG-212-E04]|nr:glycosyl transferase family 2 [Verrucomicrobia bacterium SCGC AG-212-E04]